MTSKGEIRKRKHRETTYLLLQVELDEDYAIKSVVKVVPMPQLLPATTSESISKTVAKTLKAMSDSGHRDYDNKWFAVVGLNGEPFILRQETKTIIGGPPDSNDD